LGPDPVVAIVSLGATRRLVVRPRRKQDRDRHDLPLGHGALLVMGGTCQRHYVHGVPRQAGIAGERISLTFRRLLRAPWGRRPAAARGATAFWMATSALSTGRACPRSRTGSV